MSAFYHFSAVITIKKSMLVLFTALSHAILLYLLCILHIFFLSFFLYLEILTITLHTVHSLFIFCKYNKNIESQAKCRVVITHIDKFFHNSPGAERCLGTPHFTRIRREEDFSVLFFLFNPHHFFCLFLTDM